MLQQTQVARVEPAFNAFLRRFPSVGALARAEELEVLAAWAGLGYYRRARHLHQAAKAIVERHRGKVPSTFAELKGLSGVGNYTAGAIASIVFDERVAAVDGNVHRVLSRVYGLRRPASETGAMRRVRELAQTWVDHSRSPSQLNEGLMELGATVCTPRGPSCSGCPLRDQCQARRSGHPERYPSPKSAVARQRWVHHVVVMVSNGRVLMQCRPVSGMWAGMFQPLTVESARPLRTKELQSAVPLAIRKLVQRELIVHQTTHREIEFRVYTAETSAADRSWPTVEAALRLPLSNPHRRILQQWAAGKPREIRRSRK